MFHIALYCAKLSDWFIRTFQLGAGSTWPGEVALRIDRDYIAHALTDSQVKIILIAGTNGKTTTSLLIGEGLKKAGKSVIHNPEGANLPNGVASALVRAASSSGVIKSEFAVFELDENAFSLVLSQIRKPTFVVLLNLFRDQLDRYGEVHAISARWMKVLSQLDRETHVVINGDDPRLAYIGQHLHTEVFYFGAESKDKQKKEIPHDVDSVYCPECGNKLEYAVMSYSHLGDYVCHSCHFSSPHKWTESLPPLKQFSGVYNRYNIRAAISVLHFALSISFPEAATALKDVKPAFGRQERLTAWGREWLIILSKNPSGFNQSIQSLGEMVGKDKASLCIILNDRIPDGTDVSWIWDVEFEKAFSYANSVVVTGDRTYDMAIRLKTSLPLLMKKEMLYAQQDVKKALELAMKNHMGNGPIVILATYTGMLDARKLLVGRALL